MVCLVSRSGRQMQRYNSAGGRQVVGCIPYRYKQDIDGNMSNELEGGWELDESLEEAACRESLEEAGVIGIVEHELGEWSFISKRYGTYYEGHMFPLLVKEQLDIWAEKNLRTRIWMNVVEAREVCQHWWMKEALDILVDRLTPQQKKEHLA
ncbi:hypothetical protein TSUD_11860 [Trifolium subterraneum]|uniref:Nudix hydrolase domain-containing protein n=1 Tax=Trifolium subterraneum TaxID=3900 RepID=A0A2Z6MVJ5_TRISU|nr:hypothetical protein TSUD_11860 [Trifolium subterraneum]